MAFHQQIQYQVIAEPVFTGKETITEDKWHQPWSIPVRKNPPLPVGAYQFLAYSESAQFPETVTESRWHQPWSEPIVKAKIGLRTGDQQFAAFYPAPDPFVATGWFELLSEPKRFKLGLPAGDQQVLAFQPAPSPFVATGWFNWLSEPVRQKPGLGAPLQQFFTIDTAVIPVTKLIEWFAPFSEPVRIKPGLLTDLQQFLAYHPRILPAPSVTGVMAAQEELDTLLMGLMAYNAATSADVSVQEVFYRRSQASILENIQHLGNVGLQASLPISSSGSAVTSTITARVSVREV